MNRTASPARASLAELNATRGLPRTSETRDFSLSTALQVGRWGVAVSRDGYRGQGQGGDKLHVSAVTTIVAIKPDYNWQAYCLEGTYAPRFWSADKRASARAKQLADHAAVAAGTLPAWSHRCPQPKVGDVVRVDPLCRYTNVRGTAAFTAELADTDVVSCANCASVVFGEDKATVAAEQRAAEAAAKAERKAAKPLPARCFWCGDRRPQTKATLAGEQLPCSYCKEQFETIFWVETTGYSNAYFAEFPKPHLLELGLADETAAYDTLERREGKFR